MRLGIVEVDALGKEGIDAQRIETERRGGGQMVVLGTVDTRSGPQHTRQLLKREGFGGIFTPRAAVLQRLVDGEAALQFGLHEGNRLGHLHRSTHLFGRRSGGVAGGTRAARHEECRHGQSKKFFHTFFEY